MNPFEMVNFHRPINRAEPKLAAAQYKTYEMASPIATHYKRISCRTADCRRRLKGWSTVLDVSKADHARTANWIRLQSGRAFTMTQVGTVITFAFPPGQNCFEPHQKSLERPELYLVKGGDWRGNPLNIETYKHKISDDWVDDFATHQDKLDRLIQRG